MVLQDSLLDGQWHVLHFIGYGDFDPAQDEGVLALVREDGRADLVAAHRLVDLLRQARPMPRQNLIPPLGDSRHESRAPITPALVGSGVYGAVHKLVDELCKYPGWRRDARRHARRASPVPPANYQRRYGVAQWAAGKIPKGSRPYRHQIVIHT
jgi:hypothetical protein